MIRPALHNKRVGVLRMAFLARKVFGTYEKRAPGLRALDIHAEDPGELAGFVFGCPEFNSSTLDYR